MTFIFSDHTNNSVHLWPKTIFYQIVRHRIIYAVVSIITLVFALKVEI